MIEYIIVSSVKCLTIIQNYISVSVPDGLFEKFYRS